MVEYSLIRLCQSPKALDATLNLNSTEKKHLFMVFYLVSLDKLSASESSDFMVLYKFMFLTYLLINAVTVES